MKQWLKNAALAASVLFIAAFLLISHLDNSQQLPFNNEETFLLTDGWVSRQADGTSLSISLPTRISVNAGTWLRIERDIPRELPGPLVLCMRSSQQKVRILFEGEEIYTFGLEEDAIPFGHSPGSTWNLVRLPEGSAGGHLVIELCSPYPVYSGTINEVRVGSKAALIFWLARTYLPALSFTLLIFLVGAVMILTHLIFFRRHNVGRSALYLGAFSLLVSLWLLGETRMIQFFTGNVFASMMLTMLSMLLFPIPLLLYVSDMEGFHCRKLLRRTALVLYLVALAVCAMEIWGPWDFIMMLPFFHVLLLSAGVLLVLLALLEWMCWHNAQAKTLSVSLLVIFVFGILEVAHLYATGGRNTGTFMRAGVLCFIAIQAVIASNRAAQIIRLSREATIDSLTGCMNRTAYRQQLSGISAEDCAAVMLDVNNLKFINDTYGHEAGDDALIRCAKCFMAVYQPYGSCYRLGGDEFLFLGSAHDELLLEQLAEDFCRELEAVSRDAPYTLNAALGWALFEPERDSALKDTIHRADLAMYVKKSKMK